MNKLTAISIIIGLAVTGIIGFYVTLDVMQTTLEAHPEIDTVGPPGIQFHWSALVVIILIILVASAMTYEHPTLEDYTEVTEKDWRN